MKKDSILVELQKRASEQHMVLHDVPFPEIFLFVSKKLGEYPWKFFIPLAVTLTILLHLILQKSFDEWILWLFGSL